jgi:hypothetical protein
MNFFLKDVEIIHQNILIKQYKFRFLLVLYLKIQQKFRISFFFMSKSKMRNDKTCLNCRYVVENRFCPIVDKKILIPEKRFITFYSFFEDLTHYENAFGEP